MRRLEGRGDGVDRSRTVSFTFDGRELTGFEGDTLASALLANGVDVVCRSPIHGRPRGVYSAGAEEPCAFVGVDAPFVDPVVAATTVDLVDGLIAHGVPGVGRLPAEGAPAVRCERRHAHVETLVVGGGEAGVAEANGAAVRGDRVMLVEASGSPIGDVPRDVDILSSATALGVYDDGYVVVHQRSRPVERVWHVRARNVVLATGAHERPIAFADNDRPGVMLASSARLYVERFGVLPGERAVVFTTNHGGHDAAFALRDAGVEIAGILDVGAGGSATDAARAAGIDVRSGWAVAGTDGDPRVSAVHLLGPGGERETVDADLLLVSGGWNPVVQLWRAIGGGLRYDETRACFVPDGNGPRWLSVVGGAAGEVPASAPYWFVPAQDYSRHYVDMQRDQTVADVLDAVRHDLRSVEHIKR
ncbi:MAG: 2Fe-2S iron-sulfur cluster-binding protein, partial [Actinomycetota bacterium]